jgi:hypothetical protein
MSDELNNMKILITDLKHYTILEHRNAVNTIIDEIFAYVDGTLKQQQKIIKQVKRLDYDTIYNCITCFIESGYKLTKNEKKAMKQISALESNITLYRESDVK